MSVVWYKFSIKYPKLIILPGKSWHGPSNICLSDNCGAYKYHTHSGCKTAKLKRSLTAWWMKD